MNKGKNFGTGRVTDLSPAARYVARLEELATSRIASRLDSLMAERSMTPPQLSKRSRVAINTVYSALNGDHTPKLGNLIALASGLGVTVDQLLGEPASGYLVRDAEAAEQDNPV